MTEHNSNKHISAGGKPQRPAPSPDRAAPAGPRVACRLGRGALALAIGGVLSGLAAAPAGHAQVPTFNNPFDHSTWTQYLGGADSSQYSSLDQINRDNVTELEVVWTYATGTRDYLFNPIVIDDVMYVQAHDSALVALDARTGEELWVRPHDGAIGARGINYWENEDRSDRRLLYLNAGHLTALDARTGETIRSFGNDGRADLREGLGLGMDGIRPLQTSNPGRIFEDIMIVSLPSPGLNYTGTPADIHAYDVRTGELLWVFHTIPRTPEDLGAETWPEEGLGGYAGAHNWSESTVDAERGIVYIPTGAARYDFYGGNRHGENLFSNTLLALDARTGELLWHYQIIQHDVWDYDQPNAPKLLTLNHDGQEIDAVVQVTKMGLVFVFDRETGEPVWPIEHRPVPQSDVPGEETWPTQPIPTVPPPFARQSFTEADINPYIPEEDQARVREILRTYRNEGLYTPPSLEGTIMMPGHNGGANWGSASVDPAQGRLYVVSKELPTTARLVPPGEGGGPGGAMGGGAGTDPIPGAHEDFVPYRAPVDFMLMSNGLSAIGPPWSQLTAYDLNTGEIIWQVPHGSVSGLPDGGTDTGSHAPRGGVVTTAGGLVFAATSSDRTLRAYDAGDGSVLWEHQIEAASEGVPTVYQVDGRQYVAFPTGGRGLFAPRLGLPDPAPGQYMVFALPAEE